MAPWRLLGSSWAAVGRQMAAKTALEALPGSSWGGLGGSWATLGASLGRLGPARRSREPPGKGSRRLSWCFFRCFSARSRKSDPKLAIPTIFERLRGTGPAKQPSSKTHEQQHVFVGRKAFARFSRAPQRARNSRHRQLGNRSNNATKTQGTRGNENSPKPAFWVATRVPTSTPEVCFEHPAAPCRGKRRPEEARSQIKKAPGPVQE